MALFSVQRKWVPFPSTYHSLWDDPVAHFKAFVLPAATIAIPLYAGYMRLLRADMIGTLQSDFITTARAKGVGTRRLLFGHALRPSLFSLVTSAAVCGPHGHRYGEGEGDELAVHHEIGGDR